MVKAGIHRQPALAACRRTATLVEGVTFELDSVPRNALRDRRLAGAPKVQAAWRRITG